MKKKNLVTSAVLALSSLALLAACGGGGEPTSGSTPTGSSTAVTYTITQDLPAGVELKGVPESKIIIRFWITSILLGLVALSVLKLR